MSHETTKLGRVSNDHSKEITRLSVKCTSYTTVFMRLNALGASFHKVQSDLDHPESSENWGQFLESPESFSGPKTLKIFGTFEKQVRIIENMNINERPVN